MRNTLFIGGGNMAYAIISGLLNKGATGVSLRVVDPSEDAKTRLTGLGVPCNATWPTEFDCAQVVVAVKPQAMPDVLKQYEAHLAGKLLISIAAGVSVSQLRQWSGQANAAVARTMPNTPALVGKGITGVYCTDNCTDADYREVESLFRSCGEVVNLASEDDINAITAISGSGPGYVFYWMEALAKAAQELGFNESQARQLVNHTFLGSASLAVQSDESLSTLRERVTSKGGTTFAGLEALRKHQVADGIVEGAKAAYARAIELQGPKP
ncbi:MAG TPA: pyrroline-5-carboxylate reductase [Limnobacter sp.]|uniref:pyrroline-5-carboxylate reductase n=2 Tax=Limnobacter sp. TaxID=2003368 RepID=UPI002E2FBD0A|nr:pyrroline-5-carboxylate reductase [Limnobacter sp.]HEX5487126.1 pyrroline-5-carboxylate reductase [Limnobacter sp.]